MSYHKILGNILILFTCLLFFKTPNVSAQNDVGMELIKKYAENSFRNKDYEFALENYLRLIVLDEENLTYNYRLGICYTESNKNKAAAIPYLQFVTSFNNFPEEALYYLGRVYMYNYLFTEAVEVFYEYKLIGKDEVILKEVNRLIEMSYYALEIMNQPEGVTFERLDSSINSPFDDYNPFINEEGTSMIFTSNRKYVEEISDVHLGGYMVEAKRDGWNIPEELPTNNLIDEAETVCLSYDDEYIMLYLDGYESDNDIQLAKKKGKGYIYTEKDLSDAVNSQYIEQGACIDAEGETVYFASDRPGGYGGMDLYVTKKQSDGSWSKPENLGNVINTEYDENYPSLSFDGKTLYFASKGFQGIGGYDLFESPFSVETQTWTRPRSLGFPINTPDDNTTISFSSDKSYAYLAANRKEGFGGLDIYKIVIDDEGITSIIMGTIFIGTPSDNIPYSGDIMKVGVTFLDKYGNIFAKFNVDPEGGTFFATLPPGAYKLVIEGATSEIKYQEEVTITGKEEGNLIIKEIYIKR